MVGLEYRGWSGGQQDGETKDVGEGKVLTVQTKLTPTPDPLSTVHRHGTLYTPRRR